MTDEWTRHATDPDGRDVVFVAARVCTWRAGSETSRSTGSTRSFRQSRRLSFARMTREERLRSAGHEPPSAAELDDASADLAALVAAGRAVRIGRDAYAHPDAIEVVRRRAVAIIEPQGS